MSKGKLAGIIVGCIIVVIVAIVLFVFKPWQGTPSVETYTLTTNVSPSGAGSISPSSGEYESGVQVTLTASPASGYHFANWTAPAGTFANVNAAQTTFVMPAQNVTVTANFAPFAGGSGTEGDPYQIADWYQLDIVRSYLDSYFILGNNLNSSTPGYEELAGPTANGGAGWQPIGSVKVKYYPSNETRELVNPFTGTFDGRGYEIHDLFIDRPSGNCTGLFSYVSKGGIVENISTINVSVTGYALVGALVGDNDGRVRYSYSTGYVSGIIAVGGLVGYNAESVHNSYSTAKVTGNQLVGGLVGENYDTVSNCYSIGKVTGNQLVGGLVGTYGSYVRDSFWDTQTSGQTTSAGGTGKTTAKMKSIATFSSAGWNIVAVANPDIRNPSYIWNIVDGQTYPFLSWQLIS